MKAPRILLFTETVGYRHAVVDESVDLIREEADREGVNVVHTEDSRVFSSANLDDFSATVWLQVTGDVLTAEERSALSSFLTAGGIRGNPRNLGGRAKLGWLYRHHWRTIHAPPP